MRFADASTSSIGALNQRSMLVVISSLPTTSSSTEGTNVMPISSSTSFARKRANGSAFRRSTNSLMMLRASTNSSADSIVRSAASSAYRTNSERTSGENRDPRATTMSATSASASTVIPARISRGLSRNRRRGGDGLRPGAGAVDGRDAIDVTVAGTRLPSLFCVQQILQFRHELADVAEVPVDRRETDVRDLVEMLQLFHHERADVGRRHLPLGPILQRRLDAVGDAFEHRHADRPLLARLQQAADQLLALEPLAGAVLLHDHVRDFVDPFVAREAFAAFEALASPADDLAFLGLARVDDFVAQVSAVRALHAVGCSWLAMRRSAPMFIPSCAAKKSPSSSAGPIENRCSTIAAPTAALSSAPKNTVAPTRNAS